MSNVTGQQAAAMQSMAFLTKEMIFKKDENGTSKKTGNSFRVVELHDPATLDNISLFIREGTFVDTTGIQFKDKVHASFGMDFVFGKPQMVLKDIKKA